MYLTELQYDAPNGDGTSSTFNLSLAERVGTSEHGMTKLLYEGLDDSRCDSYFQFCYENDMILEHNNHRYSLKDVLTHRSQSKPHLSFYIQGDASVDQSDTVPVVQFSKCPLDRVGVDLMKTFMHAAENYAPNEEMYVFMKTTYEFMTRLQHENEYRALYLGDMTSELLNSPEAIKLVTMTRDGADVYDKFTSLHKDLRQKVWELEQVEREREQQLAVDKADKAVEAQLEKAKHKLSNTKSVSLEP